MLLVVTLTLSSATPGHRREAGFEIPCCVACATSGGNLMLAFDTGAGGH